VQAVDYGIVPEGFVQVVPVTGSAPSLERGIRVRLSISLPGERYVHVWNEVARKNRFYRNHMQFTGQGCKTPQCDEQFWYWRATDLARSIVMSGNILKPGLTTDLSWRRAARSRPAESAGTRAAGRCT